MYLLAGEFFLSQSAQSSLSLLAHVSSPQNAFGIQSSQSVTAKDGCNVLWNRLTECLCETLCVLFICVLLWEIERTLHVRMNAWDLLGSFFSPRTHRFNRTHLRTVSSPWGGGPSPNPSPTGRGVICEVTPIRLLTYFVKVFSLTERTEFTEPFCARFEPTEGLRHTEFTERYC